MKRLTVSRIDEIIQTLESAERIDHRTEYHKTMAVSYLKNYADLLDGKGIKSVKLKEGEKIEKRAVDTDCGETERAAERDSQDR